jgi:alanine racemase
MNYDRFINWVEVNRGALSGNVRRFKSHIGSSVQLAAVVKSNAYGHGLIETSREALAAGADWLAVNCFEEAEQLRRAEFESPVICLGYVPIALLEDAVRLGLRLTVVNRETIATLAGISTRLQKKARLHIKVETGTHRQGVRGADLLGLAREIRSCPFLELEGLSTHFANIEDVTEHHYAEFQLNNFIGECRMLEENGISVAIKHTACTAAAILFPRTLFNMARVGIGLYGLWPSKETKLSALQAGITLNELEPVLTWKTRIVQVKTVGVGAPIGYGCTERANQDMRIAVLPVGYYDGYDRGFSSLGYALIRNRRAPVCGRICMNMFMVDVTHIPDARLEDEAVLLGRQGEESISADTLAGKIGTISYEVISRINPQIPRIVV